MLHAYKSHTSVQGFALESPNLLGVRNTHNKSALICFNRIGLSST